MTYLQKKKLAFMSIVNRVKGFVRTIMGALPLTLEGCVDGKSIIDYKLYGRSVQLPSEEYIPLTYIESTGKQYIDTGVVANENIGFEIEFLTKNSITSDSSKYGCIFGARTKSNTNEYQLTSFRSNNTADYKGTFRFGTNSYDGGIVAGTKNIISLKNGKYTKHDGSEATLEGDFTSPCTITIFALNNNGAPTQYGSLQLFNFKLYDGDTLLRDFIPCYRTADGTIGLYDLIENKFYQNNGTGSFNRSDLVRPDNPIEVKSVGEYDEIIEKYKIPVTTNSEGKSVTTNIYLDEPLRRVGDYADYIDFENKKVVRKVGMKEFTETMSYAPYELPNRSFYGFSCAVSNMKVGRVQSGLCTYLENTEAQATSPIWFGIENNRIYFSLPDLYNSGSDRETRVQALKDWLITLEVPFMVYYPLAEPTEETIELPNIPTFKGTSIISADTTIQPSNAEIEYYSNTKE